MRKSLLLLIMIVLGGAMTLGAQGNKAMWDLVYTFDCTSGYQYGVATDGNYIFTSSWSASSSSMFYKYDMQGNFVEEFNISGCGQLRGMTYDGEYFYGVANSSTVYCVDLENQTLVSTISSAYGDMRCITYDPVRDGFWVVGNWSGSLSLIDRTGAVVQVAPEPTSASDVAYYMDNDYVEHILYLKNETGNGEVYEYNITDNVMGTSPIFNCASTEGWTGSTGGCFVAEYDGKICFFADSQQSPQKICIYELNDGSTPITTIDEIFIGGYTAPIYGAYPDYEVYVMYGDYYTITDVEWWNNGVMEPTNVFGEGQTYMRLELTPNMGYEFVENAVAYFNDNSTIHDLQYNILEADGTLIIYTIDYYLTHPENAVTYSFEGSFDGWTTIDADGDGFCWIQASELMAGYAIPSHDGADCVTSQSYDGNYGALYPDNYLVSPLKAGYTEITFWACAQSDGWAAEHFGVAVSTGSNTNPDDFTMVSEWTMTAKRVDATQDINRANRGRNVGTWYEYNVDLSEYAGQNIWVAIRHFDCNDQYYLNVDAITLYGSGEGVAENNVNLFTMYPNPAKDNIMIESEVSVNRYDIYDVTGALIMSNEVNAEAFTVDVEALPAGSYIIRLTSDGMIQNRSLIKK